MTDCLHRGWVPEADPEASGGPLSIMCGSISDPIRNSSERSADMTADLKSSKSKQSPRFFISRQWKLSSSESQSVVLRSAKELEKV